jgi:hypothetical protein
MNGRANARSGALKGREFDAVVYAQHGHELMGCKSPVGEPKLIHDGSIITTSRRQGQIREEMSEGSPSAKMRADGQKLHRRPISGDELAQDNEVHRFED